MISRETTNDAFTKYFLSDIIDYIPMKVKIKRKTLEGIIQRNLTPEEQTKLSLNECLNQEENNYIIEKFYNVLETKLSHCDTSSFFRNIESLVIVEKQKTFREKIEELLSNKAAGYYRISENKIRIFSEKKDLNNEYVNDKSYGYVYRKGVDGVITYGTDLPYTQYSKVGPDDIQKGYTVKFTLDGIEDRDINYEAELFKLNVYADDLEIMDINSYITVMVTEKGDVLGCQLVNPMKVMKEDQTEKLLTTYDIKDIIISGYKFAFETSKTNYTLTVAPEVNDLDINVILIDEESTYKIIGNENLENGSQITIKVTDKNNKEKDYTINIVKDLTIIEKQKNKNTIIIFSTIIGIGVVATAAALIYLNNKKKKKQLENNDTY